MRAFRGEWYCSCLADSCAFREARTWQDVWMARVVVYLCWSLRVGRDPRRLFRLARVSIPS